MPALTLKIRFNTKLDKVFYLKLTFLTLFIADAMSKWATTYSLDLPISLFVRLVVVGFLLLFFIPTKVSQITGLIISLIIVIGVYSTAVFSVNQFDFISFYTNLKIIIVALIATIIGYYVSFEDLKASLPFLIKLYVSNLFFIFVGLVTRMEFLRMMPGDNDRFGFSGILPISGNEISFLLGALIFTTLVSKYASPEFKLLNSTMAHNTILAALLVSMILTGLKACLFGAFLVISIISYKSRRTLAPYILLSSFGLLVYRYLETIQELFVYWLYLFNKLDIFSFLVSSRNLRFLEVLNNINVTQVLFIGTIPKFYNLEMDLLTLVLFYGGLIGVFLFIALMRVVLVRSLNIAALGFNTFIIITSLLAGHLFESIFAILPLCLCSTYMNKVLKFKKP